MLDLRQFEEVTMRRKPTEETFLLRSSNGKSRDNVYLSLADKDCGEIVKFIGKEVKLLVSPMGEVVFARGDRRISVTDNGRGQVSCAGVLQTFESLFPDFRRVLFDGKWEQDMAGHKVYLLTPRQSYEKQESAVVGRRIEDKR